MARFQLPREFYIPKHSIKIADKNSDAVAYVVTTGKLQAAMFFGSQTKPAWNFIFRNVEAMEKRVREGFTARQEAKAHKATRSTERKQRNAEARAKVQVGDIYRTCWGYDQTNVEFFEVIEVRGAHAILREIASASHDNGHGSESCVAQSGAYLEPRFEGDKRGQPLRRLIQDGHIKIDDVRTGWPWGKRVAGVVVGESCSRTAFGWGH